MKTDQRSLFKVGLIVVLALANLPILPDYSAAAHPLSTIYDFCGNPCKNGSNPAGLGADATGDLVGVANSGGKRNAGTLYKLVNGHKFKLLYAFCKHQPLNGCSDGLQPAGSLVVDVASNLYGITGWGGAHSQGVAFRFSTDGTYKKLYDFCSSGGSNCTDGADPTGGFTYAGAETGALYDGVSPLYGLASGTSEPNVWAVAYELTHSGDTWTETVLHTFCSEGGASCTDGAWPQGHLTPDAEGNLFGVAEEGGANETSDLPYGAGVVFELSPNGSGWSYKVLYNFCSQAGCADGARPRTPLVQDSSGAFFGTAYFGGNSCKRGDFKFTCGVIYKLTPNGDSWDESVVYSFCALKDCRDGAYPMGDLVLDGAGNLYGATMAGGGNDYDPAGFGGGTLFRLSAAGFETLYQFCAVGACSDGNYPENGLILNGSRLFGATYQGGTLKAGTVFSLKP